MLWATRFSGVPQTSVGTTAVNGVLNATGMGMAPHPAHPQLTAIGAFKAGLVLTPVHQTTFVLGDDSLTIAEELPDNEAYAVSLKREYARAGQIAAVKMTTYPLHATFCSSRFYDTDAGHRVMAPVVGRTLVKMGWKLANVTATDDVWLASVAATWAHDVAHVPILRAVAQVMCTWSTALPDPKWADWGTRPTRAYKCSENGLIEFALLYDLAPSDILDCERRIATWTRGQMVDDWVIELIIRADCELSEDPGAADFVHYDPSQSADSDSRTFFSPLPVLQAMTADTQTKDAVKERRAQFAEFHKLANRGC